MRPLVIYHGNCADGFSAAWCFWRKYGTGADYVAGVYQQDPPDAPVHGDWLGGRINGRTVILRLMRDPSHRSDQWAAELDGAVVADAAGLTRLWGLLHPS